MPRVFPASFGLPFRHKIKKLLFSETLSPYKGFLRPFHPSSGRHKSQDFRSEVGIFRFKWPTLVRGHCASSLKACRERKANFEAPAERKKKGYNFLRDVNLTSDCRSVSHSPFFDITIYLWFMAFLWAWISWFCFIFFFSIPFQARNHFFLVGLKSRHFFHYDSP